MELHRPTHYDIACHFYVSHISGALIPSSRLAKILESMFQGRPLTALSLKYLQELNLSQLHQLAIGQISYEAFIADLDPALVTRERAAKAQHHALEMERLAQETKWALEAERKGEAAKAAFAAREVVRAAEDAARAAQKAEWAAQSKRNREAAEALNKAGISDPDDVAPTPWDIACHYLVNNRPDAVTSPLSNILNALYEGRALSTAYLDYLKIRGFPQLYDLAVGKTTYESYISAINSAKAARRTSLEQIEVQRLQREAAEAARIARESDPAYILRKKYGIADNIEQSLLSRLTDILQRIDAGNRIADHDFVWLNAEAKRYFTGKLREAYHLREAEFCANEYIRTQDPWNVINASGHYRKSKQPESALKLLRSVPAKSFKYPKIHSAMLTTHGGVLRDLRQHDEALRLGQKAHELQPQNFRPCTLLGALNIELGNFSEGHDWYTKAEELGASRQSIDTELKGIFRRANKTLREIMRASLFANDPDRYRWVNDKKYRSA